MANASVERFRKLTVELQQEVREAAIAELNAQGERLRGMIEQVAPRDEGILAHTVSLRQTDKPTQIRIVAGGQRTVRPGVSSKPYDYARADEFGTTRMQARPFFFPTYRLMKKKIIAAMKRRIAANIKKRSAE